MEEDRLPYFDEWAGDYLDKNTIQPLKDRVAELELKIAEYDYECDSIRNDEKRLLDRIEELESAMQAFIKDINEDKTLDGHGLIHKSCKHAYIFEKLLSENENK